MKERGRAMVTDGNVRVGGPDRPWQSCAVFCKRKDRDAFYTPRLELNNLPDVDAFLRKR